MFSRVSLQTQASVLFGFRLPLQCFQRIPWFVRHYTTNTSQDSLIYPEPPSSNHHDLRSFLEYASVVGADLKSTIYVGTHYEYMAQESLKRLGLSLKRVGGKSDYGIDLLGTWTLASVSEPLKVLVQCKALSAKVKPSQARELEGAFVGAPMGWRGPGVLGLLVSQQSATKGVREAIGRSRWPMGYVMCGQDGKILQMLWNRRAEEEGLEGVAVQVKFRGGEQVDREVVLTWKGKALGD